MLSKGTGGIIISGCTMLDSGDFLCYFQNIKNVCMMLNIIIKETAAGQCPAPFRRP